MVVILYGTETANYIQFRAQRCQKYALFQKKLQMNVVQNRILYKKVREELRINFFDFSMSDQSKSNSRKSLKNRLKIGFINWKQHFNIIHIYRKFWCHSLAQLGDEYKFLFWASHPSEINLICLISNRFSCDSWWMTQDSIVLAFFGNSFLVQQKDIDCITWTLSTSRIFSDHGEIVQIHASTVISGRVWCL